MARIDSQELAHPFTLAIALVQAALLHQFRREVKSVQDRNEALIVLSTEQRFPQWLAYGTILRGWTLPVQGKQKEGIDQMLWQRYWEPELHRLKGELLLMQQNKRQKVGEAEECFVKALDTARRQKAKSLELRIAMSLSRLLQRRGRRDEARQILAETYGWFTEGFDTADLKEANVLLEELT